MPNIFYKPSLGNGVFVLRAPAPPASRDGVYLPPLYTEEHLRQAREEAERAGRQAATDELKEFRMQLQACSLAEAENLRSAFRSLADERERILLEAAEEVVELAFSIARVVVRREIEFQPAVVIPLVRELLQRCAANSTTVRLSPRDHAALQQHLGSIPEMTGADGLRLRSDPLIRDGGCIVETEAGSLDGRIETQLERIESALRKRESEFHEEGLRAHENQGRRP